MVHDFLAGRSGTNGAAEPALRYVMLGSWEVKLAYLVMMVMSLGVASTHGLFLARVKQVWL